MIVPLVLAATCAATPANGSMPPGVKGHGSWHGTAGVWTVIPVAQYRRRPFQDKLRWWSTRSGALTVSGRRLDGTGRLVVHKVTRGVSPPGFRGRATWASRVTFPTAGCWRVTGRVGKWRLSYVLQVSGP